MSFSSDVRQELINYYDTPRHCSIAEMAAMINTAGKFRYDSDSSNFIAFHSENREIINKISVIFEKLFGAENEYRRSDNSFVIENKPVARKILSAAGMLRDGKVQKTMDSLVVNSNCCKRAYIRGCFICCGSVCDPEKNYHLEFVFHNKESAGILVKIINTFGVNAKLVLRKADFVAYIKDGEQIVDTLNIMNAHKALFRLEDVRVLKEIKNNINRRVNCETANLGKVVSASVRQIESIKLINQRLGLESLGRQLETTARIRLQNPDSSLAELSAAHNPPIGKSGINHRLKKIIEIADRLREDNKDV